MQQPSLPAAGLTLSIASLISRLASSRQWLSDGVGWLCADVTGFVAALMCHQRPEDASVFISEGHDSLLPSTALSQGDSPLGDGVKVVFACEYDGFGTLYQQ